MRRRTRRVRVGEPLSVINITNLVDVIMTTLLIYMLIAPIVEHGIEVRLPRSSPQSLASQGPVTVSVSRKGLLFLNNTAVTRDQLRSRLRDMVSAKPDLQVVVRADDNLPYGEIIAVLDTAKGSGVTNLGLATSVSP